MERSKNIYRQLEINDSSIDALRVEANVLQVRLREIGTELKLRFQLDSQLRISLQKELK